MVVRNVTTGVWATWLTPITQLSIAVSPYVHRRAAKTAEFSVLLFEVEPQDSCQTEV